MKWAGARKEKCCNVCSETHSAHNLTRGERDPRPPFPAGTWRRTDVSAMSCRTYVSPTWHVVMTSMRRHVSATLDRRHYYAMCLMGNTQQKVCETTPSSGETTRSGCLIWVFACLLRIKVSFQGTNQIKCVFVGKMSKMSHICMSLYGQYNVEYELRT